VSLKAKSLKKNQKPKTKRNEASRKRKAHTNAKDIVSTSGLYPVSQRVRLSYDTAIVYLSRPVTFLDSSGASVSGRNSRTTSSSSHCI